MGLDLPNALGFVRRRARWVGLAAGLAVAIVDVVGARSLGLAFELNGRDVTGVVWLYLALSFGGLGYLVGWLVELRRRERAALEDARRQTEELDRARLGLAQSEKLAALGQLAASISHEVRNPLAILRSSIQNLEEDPGGADDVRRSCAFLRDEIDRLDRVTGSILGFARPLEPRPRVIRAAEVLERVRLLQPLEIREKELRFEVRDDSGGAAIEVDPDLLAQALLGLVTNAAQATPGRGAVVLRARRSGGEVVLSVLDTGPGVPESDHERIFEPFFSTRKDGSGLGLAVARQIARTHGGTLQVGANPEGGACFSLHLLARAHDAVARESRAGAGTERDRAPEREPAGSAPSVPAHRAAAPSGRPPRPADG